MKKSFTTDYNLNLFQNFLLKFESLVYSKALTNSIIFNGKSSNII